MSDYYDRLESQLVALADSGAHRRRWWRRPAPSIQWPFRLDAVPLLASVLIVAVVASVLIVAGPGGKASRHAGPLAHRPGIPQLHNVYPARLPAPSGAFVCESPVTSPHRGPVHGEFKLYDYGTASSQAFITATRLPKLGAGEVYTIWMLAAVPNLTSGYSLENSVPPLFLGLIEPAPVRGRAAIARVIAARLNGPYKFLLTVQPRLSLHHPGRVVLQGFVTA